MNDSEVISDQFPVKKLVKYISHTQAKMFTDATPCSWRATMAQSLQPHRYVYRRRSAPGTGNRQFQQFRRVWANS